MPLKIGKKRVGREGRPQPICLHRRRWLKSRPVSQRLMFIRPLSPSAAVRPPKGDDWLHEPKWDGFRFQIIKDGSAVRLYSRHGAEYTDRLPGMVEAFGKLPTQSAILDGELVLIDPRGAAHFYRLMAQMRTSSPGRKPADVSSSSICCIRMALICAPCPCPNASATCTGFAASRGCRS